MVNVPLESEANFAATSTTNHPIFLLHLCSDLVTDSKFKKSTAEGWLQYQAWTEFVGRSHLPLLFGQLRAGLPVHQYLSIPKPQRLPLPPTSVCASPLCPLMGDPFLQKYEDTEDDQEDDNVHDVVFRLAVLMFLPPSGRPSFQRESRQVSWPS